MPDGEAAIRVLVVDDHALFREGVATLLRAQAGMEVAGCVGSVQDALGVLTARAIDLVLLDIELTAGRTTNFVETAREEGYAGKVLVVTAGLTQDEAQHLLQQGAGGIFLKHSAPELLVQAIRRCMAGECWIDPTFVNLLLVQSILVSERASAQKPLSPRERDVLRGIFEGLGNKEIADRLRISESSVKAALQQLFDKTGVRTRGQLVRIALETYSDQL